MTAPGPSTIEMDGSNCYSNPQAFSLTFLPAAPFVISAMEQGLAGLAGLAAILESADPALQVPAEVGHRAAQRPQAEIGYSLLHFGAETDLLHLPPLQQHCSERNAVLSRCDSLKTQAVILHAAGTISKHHIPVSGATIELVKGAVCLCGTPTVWDQESISSPAAHMNSDVLCLLHPSSPLRGFNNSMQD